MSSGGYLVPPSENPDHAELWNETWKRLDRFLPGLLEELFPGQKENSRRVSRESKAPRHSSGSGGGEEVKKDAPVMEKEDQVKKEVLAEGETVVEKDDTIGG
jgi:brefeldin A-resistance guanine nucleotide exchange factor 1